MSQTAIEALQQARKTMRNCWSAVQTNQVIDKDVEGSLKDGINRIDAALASLLTPTQQPVGESFTETHAYKDFIACLEEFGAMPCYSTKKRVEQAVAALASPQAVPGWEKAIDELERVLDQADHCLTGYGIGKVDIRGSMVELANQVAIGRKALAALNAEVSKS